MTYSRKSKDSVSHRRRRTSCHISNLCTTLLLSSSAASAFAPITPATGKSTLAPRTAVIERYRVEDESSDISQPKHQSDVYSFLPSRPSFIERVNTPSQFQTHVLEEKESIVVVRFYSKVCPSCRATSPLFTKWSRDLEMNDNPSHNSADVSMQGSQQDPLPIKIFEMPLNKATSTFLKHQLQVDQLPYCHVYHPKFGMVEEQLVLSKVEFQKFVNAVNCWSKGGCEADLESQSNFDQEEEIEFELQEDDDCEEFC
jgi:thiol-disulfide isomerase/thioredoxin